MLENNSYFKRVGGCYGRENRTEPSTALKRILLKKRVSDYATHK